MKKKQWLALALCVPMAVSAAAPVEVMVLGAYHMGNPGLDLHNAKVDDVLTDARQKELRALTDALARFAPTRVVVESRTDDHPGHAVKAYRDYLDGRRSESRNEIDQIGFRLAASMKHEAVYGIDADGDFPFEAVQAYADAHGQGPKLQQAMDWVGAKVKRFEAEQAKHSVAELLRTMNDPAEIARDHGWYMDLLKYGAGGEQPGAALVSAWYARNLQSCARLMQIAAPGDRIVLLYGAGHSYLLRQCVKEIPGWKLIEANAYLPQ